MIKISYQGRIITPEIFKFSAGEVQVKLIESAIATGECNITCQIKSSDDLIALWQTVEIIQRTNCIIDNIYIPYLPFSRMDRKIEDYSFSLKFISQMLNSFNVKILTLDCHSSSPSLLINKFFNIEPFFYHKNFLKKINRDNLYYIVPDIGAAKRYSITKNNIEFIDFIQFDKKRNEKGDIFDIKMYGNIASNSSCIVFDDICDGGATFVEIGKILKEKGANELFLFVTHGIFSKGLDELLKYYDVIGCSDSFGSYEFANQYLNNFKVITL